MGKLIPRIGRAPSLLILILALLAGCDQNDAPDDDLEAVRAPEIARLVPAEKALAGAEIPKLDPATMNDAQVRNAVGSGAYCQFRYTTAGEPVLAVNMPSGGGPGSGIIKLNGNLVVLEPEPIDGSGNERSGKLSLAADPIRMTVLPDPVESGEDRDGVRRQEANMIFEIGQNLKVGYRGYLDCASGPPTESPSH
jgi:hypothetical protein